MEKERDETEINSENSLVRSGRLLQTVLSMVTSHKQEIYSVFCLLRKSERGFGQEWKEGCATYVSRHSVLGLLIFLRNTLICWAWLTSLSPHPSSPALVDVRAASPNQNIYFCGQRETPPHRSPSTHAVSINQYKTACRKTWKEEVCRKASPIAFCSSVVSNLVFS